MYPKCGTWHSSPPSTEFLEHHVAGCAYCGYVCAWHFVDMYAPVIDRHCHIHDEMLRQGLLEHHVVRGGAYVDMYVKCAAWLGFCGYGCKVWCPTLKQNAQMAQDAQNGQGQEAFDCYKDALRGPILSAR
ncbi:hypothetical protein GOP47_0009884 [Adiantum capillus-veneris]|uniref:Uncharacterized protein n=1 Tax=Adiantum capillus-veneris TaxID=13818 RepID=A0A9D4UXF9_ADICA|nr:hypothetical protein GOP47_0009884 [Adiantum capillus-veneris]